MAVAPVEDLNKVVAFTVLFWIGKIAATTVGDPSGGALSISLRLGHALVALAVFVPLFVAQLRAKRYVPGLYWALLLSSAAVGAEISDSIDRTLHWGNPVGTAALVVGTLIALAAWLQRRGTLGASGARALEDER